MFKLYIYIYTHSMYFTQIFNMLYTTEKCLQVYLPTILLRVLTLTGLVTGGQCQSVRQESRRVGLPMYQTIVSYITQASLGNT